MNTRNRRGGPAQFQPGRRQLLTMCGVAGAAPRTLAAIIIDALVDGVWQHAQANAQGSGGAQAPRNHLYLEFTGANPRWYFDLPLHPYEPASVVAPNAHVATAFVDQGSTRGAPFYLCTPHNLADGSKIQMPWLWVNNLPTTSGQPVAMSSLLDKMLVVRGVNLLADGHIANGRKMARPVVSGPSIQGSIADQSDALIPALFSTDSYASQVFGSRSGRGATFVPSFRENPMQAIFAPFTQKEDGLSDEYLTSRAAVDGVMSAALESLAALSRSRVQGAENLYGMRHKAETIMRLNLANVVASFSAILARYQRLIAACAAQPIAGITDKPLPVTQYAANRRTITTGSSGNPSLNNSDCRTFLQSATSVIQLAEAFAVAEYMFTEGLCRSVASRVHGVSSLNLEGVNANLSDWAFDEHFTGTVPSLIVNSFMALATSACIARIL